jgi:hypothetical protein
MWNNNMLSGVSQLCLGEDLASFIGGLLLCVLNKISKVESHYFVYCLGNCYWMLICA